MGQNNKPSNFYTTLSTTIVLVLIALFLMLYFHTNNITNIVKENINILVELEDNLPQSAITNLKNQIASNPAVIANSVTFVSKEEALKMMSKDIVGLDTGENPFNNIIQFNIKSKSYSDDTIEKIKSQINFEKGVIGMYYENESIDNIKSNLHKISLGLLVLAFTFIILSLSIIFNTTRLTLLNDKKQIKTMQMVGAQNWFIKRPYLQHAFSTAVKSTLITSVLVAALCLWLMKSGNIFGEIIQWIYVGLSLFITFISAFFILILTSNATLNAFLSKE